MRDPAVARAVPLVVVLCALGCAHGAPSSAGPAGVRGASVRRAGPQLVLARGKSCALSGDGEARCWGRPMGALPDGPFKALAVASEDACAIDMDGGVHCWASRGEGLRAPGGNYRAVAVGEGFACGVLSDLSLACWGRNGEHQADPPLGQYLDVHAGHAHACALDVAGAVQCWGSNNARQAMSPSGVFVALSAGSQHNCAVREGGELHCWGEKRHGRSDAPRGRFVEVSAGLEHSCALRDNGGAHCWGANSEGQASPPTGLFYTLASGGVHSCGLMRGTGEQRCWGNNYNGESSPPADRKRLELPEGQMTRAAVRRAGPGASDADRSGAAAVSYGKIIVLGLHSLDGDDEGARALSFGLRSASANVSAYATGDENVTGQQLELAHDCVGMNARCLQGIAKGMDAAAIVYGSMRRAGPKGKWGYIVELHIFEALSGDITGSVRETVLKEQLLRPAVFKRAEEILRKLHETSL